MSLRDYWIEEIQKIEEFKAIADAIEPEILDIKGKVVDLIDDLFIVTATEKGIARREKMLKIQPFSDDTLSSRRFRVGVKWNNQLPYTYRQLQKRLADLVGDNGFVMTRNTREYTLKVKINLGVKRMLQDVDIMVKNMAPCNLVITVELQYNRHIDISGFTHEELGLKTHLQIREEVL